jgi:hypothetical protein
MAAKRTRLLDRSEVISVDGGELVCQDRSCAIRLDGWSVGSVDDRKAVFLFSRERSSSSIRRRPISVKT